MLISKQVVSIWTKVSESCLLAFDERFPDLGHFYHSCLLQKFSSASKYAALSVDGEDENEGEDYTE